MNREWLMPAKILTGVCVLAASSFSQTYTISAKPGAVNYIQGDVSVNGDPVWSSNLKSTFLNANDVIAVKNGRAEVLLTPGVFLRVGENAQVRMIKPSLVETQIEVLSGESMVEVDDFVPGSSVAVVDHGSSTTLTKAGLYRFTETTIATLDGKADVAFGASHIELKKDREVAIAETLHATKVDLNQGDDLYAWSNTRAQYNAAATYAGARSVYDTSSSAYSSSFNSNGWFWNSPFNSFMWMPGNGAFYSPFGWGFYGPGVVAYAPVFLLSLLRLRLWWLWLRRGRRGHWQTSQDLRHNHPACHSGKPQKCRCREFSGQFAGRFCHRPQPVAAVCRLLRSSDRVRGTSGKLTRWSDIPHHARRFHGRTIQRS